MTGGSFAGRLFAAQPPPSPFESQRQDGQARSRLVRHDLRTRRRSCTAAAHSASSFHCSAWCRTPDWKPFCKFHIEQARPLRADSERRLIRFISNVLDLLCAATLASGRIALVKLSAVSSADPGQDRALASNAQEPNPA